MIEFAAHDHVRPIRWMGDRLELLDQRKLPLVVEHVVCADSDAVAAAIRDLVVRGAPAIGIAAAWGVVLAAQALVRSHPDIDSGAAALAQLEPALERLREARPTAVNLMWAIARMRRAIADARVNWLPRLLAEAEQIVSEDLAANHAMGLAGAQLIEPGSGVLTHCNTGSLATAGFGTALGVVRTGVTQHRIARVFAGETRPWLQGARLTVWELQQDGIDATLIADSAAAHLMASGQVQWVIVGADRICANGDVANKIGTHQLAIVARHFGVKFMVVAPSSTVDMGTASGERIHIELRHADELTGVAGARHVADGVQAWNPVFDVTLAPLIDAIVTERGVVTMPDASRMAAFFGPKSGA
ncbi:MAG: S-methyl-5-thioribose-1-phosphate isomerase [Proteobacteria bacterium]|nr:S-methyl-5-thioribose-1-phosphate isomerase [Pseudomonadota bacterium]